MKVGYWKQKGRAFPIRCLLHHAGIEFEDVLYSSENKDTWFAELKPEMAKTASPMAIPSIPYLVDGEVTIFQSMAVLRYAGRKSGYVAQSEAGIIIEDSVEGVLTEVFEKMRKARFSGDERDVKQKEFLPVGYGMLQSINDLLEKSKYLTGEKLAWIDFYLFQMVVFMEFIGGSCPHAKINALRADLEGNARLAAYLESVKDVACMP